MVKGIIFISFFVVRCIVQTLANIIAYAYGRSIFVLYYVSYYFCVLFTLLMNYLQYNKIGFEEELNVNDINYIFMVCKIT